MTQNYSSGDFAQQIQHDNMRQPNIHLLLRVSIRYKHYQTAAIGKADCTAFCAELHNNATGVNRFSRHLGHIKSRSTSDVCYSDLAAWTWVASSSDNKKADPNVEEPSKGAFRAVTDERGNCEIYFKR